MSLSSDLGYAFRTLRKSPSFTATAIGALALGIGANAAIFSLADALLLRPLPLAQPDRLVEVWEDGSAQGFPHDTPAPGNFAEWKMRNHVFTGIAALRGTIFALTGDGQPEQVEGSPITANLLPVLGVAPILGRNISAQEDRPGGANVALISHRLWHQRYGAERSVVGRDILLDGVKYRVIGVLPPGFIFPDRTDVWTPLALSTSDLQQRHTHYLQVFARLRPGVTLAEAQREMTGIARQLEREYPETNTRLGAAVVGLREEFLGKLDLAVRILAAGVGCVLLICCANIAGLLLARAAVRQRDAAIRAALGASRFRLVRQGMAESLLIALSGAGLGVMFASFGVPLLGKLVPEALTGWAQPRLDMRLVAFAAVAAAASAVLFGALPALSLARVDLAAVLQMGGRTGTGGQGVLRRALVAGEVALAVVLTVGAGLMLQTVWGLLHVDLGFQPEQVLTMRTALPATAGSPYSTLQGRNAFYRAVEERVRAIPGVRAAGYTTFLPLTNRGGTSGFLIEGAPPPAPGHQNDANHRDVSSGYFNAIGMRLTAGRSFDEHDGAEAPLVAVINEAMAKQYFRGTSPLGHRIRFASDKPWITIVGVVADVRQMGLDVAGRAEMYFSCTQPVGSAGFFSPRDLAVKVRGDPMRYVAAVKEAIWQVDRNQPIADVQPLSQLIRTELKTQTAQLWLLGAFAALALLLSAIGIYGLLSYLVAQRTRDIGLRLALGAGRGQVLAVVMRQGMELVAAGLCVGTAAALWLTKLMQGLLYGVRAADPVTFGVVALVLGVVGVAACYAPARRAMRIDPMQALRGE